jgi:Fe2+ or Zn2+ uptake regulation protein
MTSEERLDAILDLVRRRGGRVTTSRRAIVAALLEAPHHVTADQLAETVQAVHPDVHQSTVYRTLDTLAELGVVDHVHLGHGPAVYHFTDQPHHHLVCRQCGRVEELPLSTMAPVERRIARDYSFQLDATHFALTGLCDACR